MTLRTQLGRAGRRALEPVAAAIPSPVLRRWTRLAGWTVAYSARTRPGADTLRHALALIMAPQRAPGRDDATLCTTGDIAARVGADEEEIELWAASGVLGEPADPGPPAAWAPPAVERARLVVYLRSQGVGEQAIREAAAQDRIALLLVDRAIAGRGRLTGADVAERAAATPDFVQAVLRALGLPREAWSEPIFTRREVEAMRILGAMREVVPDADLLEVVGVMGRAVAQVAASEVEITQRTVWARLAERGYTELDIALRTAAVVDLLVGPTSVLLDVAHRRHLEAAGHAESVARLEAATGRLPGQVDVAVGFADLVGFTAASERLSELELGEMSAGLLRAAESVFADHRTRVVKTIGDAVMFVARETADACCAAVELAEAARSDGLPPVHAGIACGPVLSRRADYFGRTVNVASRLCAVAPGDTVLLAGPLPEPAAGALTAAGLAAGPARSMRLKGLREPVEALAVERAGRRL